MVATALCFTVLQQLPKGGSACRGTPGSQSPEYTATGNEWIISTALFPGKITSAIIRDFKIDGEPKSFTEICFGNFFIAKT